MILIHPPSVKPCEAPAGIAKLAGCLAHHHVKYTIVDANLEIILRLLEADGSPLSSCDTWTTRARRHLARNVQLLTSPRGYENIDRYKKAVWDVNRVLERSTERAGVRLSLSNYVDDARSPVKSIDLIRMAEEPERSPFAPYFKKRFLDLLEQKTPRVVGFSLNFLNQALSTFAMIGFLKQVDHRLRIVLGGGLVTSWMRNPAWVNPFKGLVDDLVPGAGEGPLLSILGIENGNGDHLPDCTFLSQKGYLAPGSILPYSASSGCYWGECSFCPEKAEGNPWKQQPEKSMISAVRTLVAGTRPVLVHFLDNALSPAHLRAISEEPFGVPWYGFARVTDQLRDLDFCRALKRSGCVMLQIGIESGDQGVLDDMGKGLNVETASVVLKNLHESGIAPYVYLLFGTPTETLEKARKTLAFSVAHSRYIRFLNLAVFNLPAYGPDVKNLQTEDFYAGDLSLYRNFMHPKGWNRQPVREFLDREFRKHPAMASIVKRTPPIFTSNHAPFFCYGEGH